MGPDELRRQAQLEDRHFWYAARRRQVLRVLPPAAREGARALDLGAGSGGNTTMLKAVGYDALALEHHPLAAGFARSRGVEVVRADAERLPFSNATFDLVLACDVLEHLRDDSTALREVQRVLRPGGALVVTVPADPRLWSPHDLALQHFRRYTTEGLTKLLEEQGLLVASVRSWMVLLRAPVAIRRRLTRRRAESAPSADELVSDLEPVSKPLNWVLGAILRVEHHLPALGTRRGVSLIAVAHHPSS